jgi:hypothetical protein
LADSGYDGLGFFPFGRAGTKSPLDLALVGRLLTLDMLSSVMVSAGSDCTMTSTGFVTLRLRRESAVSTGFGECSCMGRETFSGTELFTTGTTGSGI